MPFHYLLTNLLVDVPEAVGAIFLDGEGEAVEWVSQSEGEPYHLKVEGAHHAVIKRQLTAAVETQAIGRLGSYVFVGRHLATLTEILPHGYYVVLVVHRSGSLSRARYHLSRISRVIADEI
jgi:hypothetical protein